MPRARGGRAPRVSSPPTPSARRKELVGKQAVKRKASNGEDDEEEAICSICRFELEDKVRFMILCRRLSILHTLLSFKRVRESVQ